MTEQQHPITPPPELVKQWCRTAPHSSHEREHYHYITLRAAQWGSDQELEACVDWLLNSAVDSAETPKPYADALRADRRPKPPSLKEQALEHLSRLEIGLNSDGYKFDSSTIRRALESLE